MVADEQTHTLPADREGLERFARFAGFADRDGFADALLGHLRNVQRHYATLFESAPAAEARAARARRSRPTPTTARRSTGSTEMGFQQPLEVVGAGAALARRRLSRRCAASSRATSSPSWCRCCSTSSRARTIPTRRCIAFDRFLAGLHGGGRLFSLLRQNPDLVALIALVLGTAPRLADILAQLSRRDGRGDRSELLRRAAGRGRARRRARPLARRRRAPTRTSSTASASSRRSRCS